MDKRSGGEREGGNVQRINEGKHYRSLLFPQCLDRKRGKPSLLQLMRVLRFPFLRKFSKKVFDGKKNA